MKLRTLFAILTLTIAGATASLADQWNRSVKVTFDRPVAVPAAQRGVEVLPAGTYVFKIADNMGRDTVLVYNEQEDQLLATVLALPVGMGRPDTSEGVTFNMRETAAGKPLELHDMYYLDHDFGEEFVYPDTK